MAMAHSAAYDICDAGYHKRRPKTAAMAMRMHKILVSSAVAPTMKLDSNKNATTPIRTPPKLQPTPTRSCLFSASRYAVR